MVNDVQELDEKIKILQNAPYQNLHKNITS